MTGAFVRKKRVRPLQTTSVPFVSPKRIVMVPLACGHPWESGSRRWIAGQPTPEIWCRECLAPPEDMDEIVMRPPQVLPDPVPWRFLCENYRDHRSFHVIRGGYAICEVCEGIVAPPSVEVQITITADADWAPPPAAVPRRRAKPLLQW